MLNESYLTFSFDLVVEQIDCETVDGIHTTETISLNQYQEIPGDITFRSLDVLEDLKVIVGIIKKI